ncbi:endonuclease/exonuclease/phosphatase family protein [Arthrobacter globiformis]|uniref:Endonuclease/exonuclease/phosphatase family protein n=1 Tax=Arthrobacter globiformis TaxID=1665 RepID=A0A328HAJ6_ARTGO|nr:endonuclease/exonuclease/phosphatase family protein [Arthrobacter globiformis]RAM35519.1 endonuclease/exonuclease/phosphatase family protein [Arthrobacter globiformis]
MTAWARRTQTVWLVLALCILLPVASLSVFRAIPGEWPTLVVQLLSFTPWLVIPAALALALALLGRRHLVTAAAALLLAAQLFWLWAPDAGRADEGAAEAGQAGAGRADSGASRTGSTVPLTVMSINSRFGRADAADIVRLVRDNGVELLAIQEFTQALEDRLAAAGLGSLLPNRISSPTENGSGSATYSKHAIQAIGLVPDTPFQMPSFRVTVPVAGGAVAGAGKAAAAPAVLEVTNVHTLPPADVRVGQWRSDLESLGRLVARNGADGQNNQLTRNQLLLGDFNATYDHAEFRRLLDGGPGGRKLVDVGMASGARFMPTWPMDGQALPGITIDHLVTSPRIPASGYAVHRVPGTDHAAVLATLEVPTAG